MQRIMAPLLALAMLVAGCAQPATDPDVQDGSPPAGDDPAGSGSQMVDEPDCETTRQQSGPDGQPWGTFDHSLANGLEVTVDVIVEHVHENGCVLGSVAGTLAPGEVLGLEYEEHLWKTEQRIITIGAEDAQYRVGVDWACSWDMRFTQEGLEKSDPDEPVICA